MATLCHYFYYGCKLKLIILLLVTSRIWTVPSGKEFDRKSNGITHFGWILSFVGHMIFQRNQPKVAFLQLPPQNNKFIGFW